MAANPQIIAQILLINPNVAAMSDADAAAASCFAPVYTPRVAQSTLDYITYTSLAAILGTATAIMIQQALLAQIAVGGSSGAQSQFVNSILLGPGFDPQNPEVAPLMAAYEAGGVIGSGQSELVTNIQSYPAGVAVQTSDVTAARPVLALMKFTQGVNTAFGNVQNEWVSQQTSPQSQAAVIAQLQSALTAQGIS